MPSSAPTCPFSGVMGRLKTETAALHDRAERCEFQKLLASGRLARDLYVANLGQLLLVHRAVEAGLRQLLSLRPEVARLVTPDQFHSERLIADRAFLGAHDEPRPVEGAAWLIERIRQESAPAPISILGFHYVLEGSTNGGRFIARGVRRGYGLELDGTRYLDPYGEEQPARWGAFRSAMSDLPLAPGECDLLVRCAADTFEGIRRIGENLLAPASA